MTDDDDRDETVEPPGHPQLNVSSDGSTSTHDNCHPWRSRPLRRFGRRGCRRCAWPEARGAGSMGVLGEIDRARCACRRWLCDSGGTSVPSRLRIVECPIPTSRRSSKLVPSGFTLVSVGRRKDSHRVVGGLSGLPSLRAALRRVTRLPRQNIARRQPLPRRQVPPSHRPMASIRHPSRPSPRRTPRKSGGR
jgi:hypothetical protein